MDFHYQQNWMVYGSIQSWVYVWWKFLYGQKSSGLLQRLWTHRECVLKKISSITLTWKLTCNWIFFLKLPGERSNKLYEKKATYMNFKTANKVFADRTAGCWAKKWWSHQRKFVKALIEWTIRWLSFDYSISFSPQTPTKQLSCTYIQLPGLSLPFQ